MKNILKVAAAAAFVAVPMQANAVTEGVPFEGTVTSTCIINVNNGGTLVADAGFQNLSSSLAGGIAGDADIIATGNGYNVSIDVPANFSTEPATDLTTETLSGSFSTTGASSVSGSATGGNSSANQSLSNGTTDVTVNLAASKTGSDVFVAGTYEATITLRCE